MEDLWEWVGETQAARSVEISVVVPEEAVQSSLVEARE